MGFIAAGQDLARGVGMIVPENEDKLPPAKRAEVQAKSLALSEAMTQAGDFRVTLLVTGTPIVPVAIYGNRWSESLFKVNVAFGRPHYFDSVRATPGNIADATTAVWADVQELWDALKADRLF